MPSTAELALLITARDQASKVIGDVGKSASGLGSVLGKVGTIAAGFLAANVISGGVQKLTGFIGDSIGAAKESIAVNAQLDAVLKSTGNAVGLTAKQITDYAAVLEKKSLFEDEAIIAGQNLLLTFTNLGGDVMLNATEIMLDMAQAMGTDAKGSAIQLGKALNDPMNGISALTRVGVTFTDQQKKQIKTMQEAGDMAGAQGIILAELNKEFGGSAKAASDAAGSAEKYKDRMNDLKETIGAKLLPIQMKWQEVQVIAIGFIADKAIPALEKLAAIVGPILSAAFNTLLGSVKPIVDLFKLGLGGGEIGGEFSKIEKAAFTLGKVFKDTLIPAFNDLKRAFDLFMLAVRGGEAGGELTRFQEAALSAGAAVRGFIQALTDAVGFIKTHQEILAGVATTITVLLIPALIAKTAAIYASITAWIALRVAQLSAMAAVVLANAPLIALAVVIGLLVAAIIYAIRHWDEIKAKVTEVADVVKEKVIGAFGAAADFVKGVFNGILDGAIMYFRRAVNQIIDVINSAISAYNKADVLGIAPDVGPIGHITESLADAVQRIYGQPVQAESDTYAKGTPYVPRTGLALLHKGEAVIPAEMNRGGGGAPVVNVYVQGSVLSERDLMKVIRDALAGGGFGGYVARPA